MSYRNILIITLGETPALVTETVWALLRQADRFIPDEIHLVTTARGRARLLERLSGPASPLAALLESEGLAAIEPVIHLPRGDDGREAVDIRSEDENIAFANTLTRLIKALTDRDDTRLHVSMAGGRKTMSAYASLAISLFGRDRDGLSHVLVEPEALENAADFFWPDQPRREITDRGGRVHRASDARVLLVETPFVRLRHLLRRIAPFPGGEPDYRRIVLAVQAALQEPLVRLDVAARTLEVVGFEPVQLGHKEFAFYLLLATARIEGWVGAGPDGVGEEHAGWLTYELLFAAGRGYWRRFLALYDDMFVRGTEHADDLREVLLDAIRMREQDRNDKPLALVQQNRFQPMKSSLVAAIGEGIPNPSIAAGVNVATIRKGVSRFGLLLAPERIHVVPRDPHS